MSKNDAAEVFLRSVTELCPKVTDDELDFLRGYLDIVTLGPKEFYLRAGRVQRAIGFVSTGLLRAFYLDKNGDEISVNFIPESSYATHYSAFIAQVPSQYSIQGIEPSIIVNLDFQTIQRGYERYPSLERYGRLIAEMAIKLQQRRIEAFLFDSAEKRYLDFIEESPDLFNRVSLTHLASYLGIERQSLTRIRNKLVRPKF
jgi:CRP/FNR family transcriptional regulator